MHGRFSFALLIASLALALAACGSLYVRQGDVMAKYAAPSHQIGAVVAPDLYYIVVQDDGQTISYLVSEQDYRRHAEGGGIALLCAADYSLLNCWPLVTRLASNQTQHRSRERHD